MRFRSHEFDCRNLIFSQKNEKNFNFFGKIQTFLDQTAFQPAPIVIVDSKPRESQILTTIVKLNLSADVNQ